VRRTRPHEVCAARVASPVFLSNDAQPVFRGAPRLRSMRTLSIANPLLAVLFGACAAASTRPAVPDPILPPAGATNADEWRPREPAPEPIHNPCDGVACAVPSRCIAWSSGARCIERPEDAVPWWPDDACDAPSFAKGSFCSLTGTGFECIHGRPCHEFTDGGAPECFRGQECTAAASCGSCPPAATTVCAFPPPAPPEECGQYLSRATECLPADLKGHLAGELDARMQHRLRERANGAARGRLWADCRQALFTTSTWCFNDTPAGGRGVIPPTSGGVIASPAGFSAPSPACF
jgi:hypothetical protein